MQNELEPKSLLQELIYHLVDYPDQVNIFSNETAHTATFDIEVAEDDVGKVLGRRGSHAEALRVVFGAIYGKLGKRVHLQVIDPRR